ncbi:P-loop containing nucleoside triphosphate hydrolase protein [Thelonectria olida]|uniref:P-loop containing nucleoside triphosphate hydrolase protein n=1 Tax=Thelonectria olida TaxID=1576542 RepID=A0A9P8W0R2_9HYPO|nr:P-loop containing nucleoside triphosphate hydrolase protein [Thelonectria olida]
MAPSLIEQAPATNNNSQGKSYNVLEYSDEIHAEVPKDLRIGDFGYKYRMVDGKAMPPYITPKRYELSRNIQTRGSDICFVSYPKSGSTWLSYIIVLLTGSEGTTLRNSLHWVESSWTYPRSREELENAPAPRIFKSHMPYSMGLGGVPARNPCKYIYIARNPKDWEKLVWDHRLQMFLDVKAQRDDWFDHVLSWWEHKDAENVLFLAFEELKRNTESQLRRIAEFLDIELSPEKLEEIRSKIGFSQMQKTQFSALKDVKEFNKFFRKGEIGSWKEYFTVAQSERFDQVFKERVGASDLDFAFECDQA